MHDLKPKNGLFHGIHDLGIDAAFVAVLWQYLAGRELGVVIPFGMSCAVFFAVWSVYLGDRLWDGLRAAGTSRLARSLPWLFAVLVLASGLLGWIFALRHFQSSQWGAIFLLLIGVLAYYAVRWRRPDWALGRAFCVGTIFAMGVLLPVWALADVQILTVVLQGAALVILFTANVRLCLGGRGFHFWPGLAVLLFCGVLWNGGGVFAICGVMAGLGLWRLGIQVQRSACSHPGVWADWALLLPTIVGLIFLSIVER